MTLTESDPLDVGVLERTRGTAYTFVENRTQPWSWRSMLASFPDDVLEQVVGCGAVAITCEPLQGSYDHKRHHAARLMEGPALSGQAPIWDFVVTQGDGAQVRFHPQQTSSKVGVSSKGGPAFRAAAGWLGRERRPWHMQALEGGRLPPRRGAPRGSEGGAREHEGAV